jgi:hypothetical protein
MAAKKKAGAKAGAKKTKTTKKAAGKTAKKKAGSKKRSTAKKAG